jgi:multidrug efflux pump subunit AcrB
MRVWIDPDKLAARNLTAADVVKALKEQNAQVPKGQDAPIMLRPTGRLADPEQLSDTVLHTDAEGRTTRLKDVAHVELGAANEDSHAGLDGKPVVLLCVYPTPGAKARAVSTAVRDKVAELRARLPAGVDLTIPFDFASNWEAPGRSTNAEYLLLDPDLPAEASPERAWAVLKQGDTILRETAGVQQVLTLTENPFDHARRPCLLVCLDAEGKEPVREQLMEAIRKRLGEVKGMTLRLRDLSGPNGFPRCGYPIDLAVHGPEMQPVRDMAQKLVDRLRKSEKLADVADDPGSRMQPQLYLDVDRTQAKLKGVSLDDVFTTLQTFFGAVDVNDFNRFGRTWQVRVQVGNRRAGRVEDVKKLKVRNARGEMVPLGTFVSVKEVEGPAAVDRLNGEPMVEITAKAAAGVSHAEVRTLCEDLAEEVRKELRLPKGYGLTWLQEMPAPR